MGNGHTAVDDGCDMKHLEYFRRDNRGSVVVEFAVIMPFILFFTMGFIQLAHLFVARMVVDYASYCAARSELVGEDPLLAARIVCSTISGPRTYTASPGDVISLPGWGKLPHSASTSVNTSVVRITALADDQDHVSVQVIHYCEMLFPIFSNVDKIGAGPVANRVENSIVDAANQDKLVQRDRTHWFYRMESTFTLSKPWPGT